jgi:hypothetical protein
MSMCFRLFKIGNLILYNNWEFYKVYPFEVITKLVFWKLQFQSRSGSKAPSTAISSVSVICDQLYDLASLFSGVRWISMSVGPATEPSFASSMGNCQPVMGRSTGTSHCSHFYALVCPSVNGVTTSTSGDLQMVNFDKCKNIRVK